MLEFRFEQLCLDLLLEGGEQERMKGGVQQPGSKDLSNSSLSSISSVVKDDAESAAEQQQPGVTAEVLDYSDAPSFNGSFSCSLPLQILQIEETGREEDDAGEHWC